MTGGSWGTSTPDDQTVEQISSLPELGERLAFYATLIWIRKLPVTIRCPWEEQ